MKLGKLKQLITDLDDDVLVVIASDAEGNNYSPVGGYNTDYHYQAESSWNGYLMMDEIDFNAEQEYEDEENRITYKEYLADSEPCVVLWPIS